MGTDIDTILTTWRTRQTLRSPQHQVMAQIRDLYNGDLIVPLPELDKSERSAVANFVNTGVERTAQKIADLTPNLWFPPVQPGNRASEKRAAIRRRAVQGWWEANRYGMKQRRRARYFVGYGSGPVILRPDSKLGIARWDVRDPLTTYPSPSNDPDDLTPTDCLFHYQRTHAWLKQNYPTHLRMLETGRNPQPNDRYDLIEWADANETVLVCVGRQPDLGSYTPAGLNAVELERTPNRTGMCLAVVPGRITLDRNAGQFDQMIGPYMAQAKLMALEMIAVKKGVFPTQYLVSRQGEVARFIAGPFDGLSGQINIVQGGDMREENLQPGYKTDGMLDRLERTQRLIGGLPAEYGGESPTNVRTGKRGDAIMAEVVDPVISEAHEVFALAAQEENKRAIAIAKHYFGSTPRTFYIGTGLDSKRVDYIPNRDFEDDNNIVTYPMAGTDVNGLIVGAGQRMGLGTMSRKTFMELDPQIADPERELDRVETEALEQAVLQSIQQQAASGALPLVDVARIMELRATGTSLLQAVQKAQEEAQQRQASTAPPAAPELQPGLSLPGNGVEGQPEPATVGPPSQNISNLAQTLSLLQRSGRTTRPSPVPQAG